MSSFSRLVIFYSISPTLCLAWTNERKKEKGREKCHSVKCDFAFKCGFAASQSNLSGSSVCTSICIPLYWRYTISLSLGLWVFFPLSHSFRKTFRILRWFAFVCTDAQILIILTRKYSKIYREAPKLYVC